MKKRDIDAEDAPVAAGNYAQALEISAPSRLLFVSGQIPVTTDGSVPASFAAQCRLVWHHVEAQLRAADMRLADIVKVTTFLSDRADADENGRIRQAVLGDVRPALTVVVAGIFDPSWLLEIEVVAAV